MRFTKFGKALLVSAFSVGAILGVTSCVQSYTVGFLYVTGNSTSQSNGNGIITGFKIDHNTGNLKNINGLPVASGGANPGRAVLITGGRFLYVLNRGTNSAGNANCTEANPCKNPNITEFAVGGNGILTPQETFFTQGINPFRLIADGSGNYIYVLDQIAPDSSSCSLALGAGVTSCGDITAFKVDQSTGRLSLVINAQVTAANGSPLPYFPVPVNPVDFVLTGSYVITLSGDASVTAGTQAGDVVFPYTYNSATGQLSVNQNTVQPINSGAGTAIVNANGGTVYVLDNEPLTIAGVVYQSQVLPFSVGTGGALQAQTGGAVPDDPNQSNPIMLISESKGKWVYIANSGNNTASTNAQSGIVGKIIDPATKQLTVMPDSPFTSGSGPQCMIEDPSNQFIYTANFNDSSVTGKSLDVNSGDLRPLPGKANRAFPLNGPAAWCLVSGRTS
jgi:6-phosphogluconolactonase (cycloisomerase 2 family)